MASIEDPLRSWGYIRLQQLAFSLTPHVIMPRWRQTALKLFFLHLLPPIKPLNNQPPPPPIFFTPSFSENFRVSCQNLLTHIYLPTSLPNPIQSSPVQYYLPNPIDKPSESSISSVQIHFKVRFSLFRLQSSSLYAISLIPTLPIRHEECEFSRSMRILI